MGAHWFLALPALVFVLHVAEEYPGFPEWATRHFGTTSRAFFVYSHVPLVAGIIGVAGGAIGAEAGSPWIFLALAGQWILFSNGLFHLGTTVLFREYSPGVVTGTLLFLPSTWLVARRTSEAGLLAPWSLLSAAVLGVMVGAAIIASLWLDMNFDWRLRRVAAAPPR